MKAWIHGRRLPLCTTFHAGSRAGLGGARISHMSTDVSRHSLARIGGDFRPPDACFPDPLPGPGGLPARHRTPRLRLCPGPVGPRRRGPGGGGTRHAHVPVGIGGDAPVGLAGGLLVAAAGPGRTFRRAGTRARTLAPGRRPPRRAAAAPGRRPGLRPRRPGAGRGRAHLPVCPAARLAAAGRGRRQLRRPGPFARAPAPPGENAAGASRGGAGRAAWPGPSRRGGAGPACAAAAVALAAAPGLGGAGAAGDRLCRHLLGTGAAAAARWRAGPARGSAGPAGGSGVRRCRPGHPPRLRRAGPARRRGPGARPGFPELAGGPRRCPARCRSQCRRRCGAIARPRRTRPARLRSPARGPARPARSAGHDLAAARPGHPPPADRPGPPLAGAGRTGARVTAPAPGRLGRAAGRRARGAPWPPGGLGQPVGRRTGLDSEYRPGLHRQRRRRPGRCPRRLRSPARAGA